MNKKQITNYIIDHLQNSGKAYKTPSERLAYDLGYVISILAEVCEHDSVNTAILKKKLNRLKQFGAPNKN